MFTETIVPRLCETDFLGHINNTVMPVWLEQGRGPLFRLFTGDATRISPECFPLLLAHLAMDFRLVVHYGIPAEVRSRVVRIGNSSLELQQQIWQEERLCVEAKAIIVHVDTAAQRPAPIPQGPRQQLQAWLDADTDKDQ